MENKNAVKDVSYKPLAYLFGALGLGLGRNIGRLTDFNSPSMAGISVFILSLLSAYVLYSIGAKIVKSINAINAPRDKKVSYTWIAGIVGAFLIIMIVGATAK